MKTLCEIFDDEIMNQRMIDVLQTVFGYRIGDIAVKPHPYQVHQDSRLVVKAARELEKLGLVTVNRSPTHPSLLVIDRGVKDSDFEPTGIRGEWSKP